MLRWINSSISRLLYAMVAVAAVGLLALLGVFSANMESAVATQSRLNALSDLRAAALTSQYDFADFNGWQTAYALDVAKLGPRRAAF